MTKSTMKKFITVAFAAGMSLGLLFTSISFVHSQQADSKDAVLYFTISQAKMISSNVKCALTFEDQKDANEVLDSLKNQCYIAYAGIYDCNGRLFTAYHRDGLTKQNFTLLPPPTVKIKYADGYLVISEPVILDKEFLGTVCLWAQL